MRIAPLNCRLKTAGVLLAVFICSLALALGCMEKKRTGKPDGSSEGNFSILLSGNWMGHLGPCGCTDKQLGGIDRRTEKLQEIAPDKSRRLLIDAGPLIEQSDRQSQLKLQTFLYSMKELGYDAVGLTPEEIVLLHETIDTTPADRPVIVCSNMSAENRKIYGVQNYVFRALKSKGRVLNALVMAVADGDNISNDEVRDKVNLKDPLASVKEILSSLNIRADQGSPETLVVVMTSDSNETLMRQLQEIKAIDLLVKRGFFDEPEKIASKKGKSITVTTGKMGKYLAQVTVPGDVAIKAENFGFKAVEILDTFKQDPAITAMFTDYQMRMELEKLIEEGLSRMVLPDPENSFVGSHTCQRCHGDIFKQWQKSKHGHALLSLTDPKVNRQYDPECMACHTVGMRYETGYRSIESTPNLANVGCEMCHGPGSKHVKSPKKNPYLTAFVACEDCHDHENSPRFEANREHYFKEIRHWKNEPRQHWK
ncbi:MAG: cytochrome c family protein [Phycisphaerae bacterium]|nr:cytochrome c family protein [Phycisphaerae bacterium]